MQRLEFSGAVRPLQRSLGVKGLTIPLFGSSDSKMFAVETNLVFRILHFIHRCSKRHVLLKFLYLGWDYQGYATQEDTANTIEHHLFSALVMCCLVESRQTSNYGRCGRTDKGVSSFSQVYCCTVCLCLILVSECQHVCIA